MKTTRDSEVQSTSAQKLRNVEDIYPLSPMQQGMLLHSLNEPGSGMYFVELGFRIEVALDVPAFRRAWEEVVRRHAILRTGFLWKDLDEPVQVVRQNVELPWREEDWRGQSESEHEEKWKQFSNEERKLGFDLKQAPLMRLTLMRTGEESYYFSWNSHHILLDGWCRQIVMGEAMLLYEAYKNGQTPRLERPRPYRDYIEWLQKQDEKKTEAFWRKELQGFFAPTRLGIERDRRELKEDEEVHGSAVRKLDIGLTAKLEDLARRQQVTLNTVAQGAWALVLSRYSREKDVIFGATVSGRSGGKVGFDKTVGLFINTLPVRVEVREEEDVPAYLKRLQLRQAEALNYEYSPLLKVQGWSEVPRGTPLFENIMVFDNYPVDTAMQKQAAQKMKITALPGIEASNYSLALGCSIGPESSLLFEYHRRLFDAQAIERLLAHLQAALEGLAAGNEKIIAQISLLPPAERHQLLVEWNSDGKNIPYECAHELFEEQVEKRPSAAALLFEDEVISYAELNARGNRLAHYLGEQGVGVETRVGICVRRSPELIVGLLGILKAGGAYAALDVNTPASRLGFIFNDAQVRLVIADSATEERVRASGWQGLVLLIDRERLEWMKRSAENPCREVAAENLAYMVYTSGSTGEPKGTEVPHRSLTGFIWDVEYAVFDERQTLLQHSSVSWDALTLELWPALLRGGRCVLYSGEILTSEEMRRVVQKYGVTTLWLTSSVFSLTITTNPETLRGVKQVLTGGEVVSLEHVRQAARLFPEMRIVNGYGPSECTVFSTCYVIPRELPESITSLSIGRPVGDRKVYLLDRNMNLAAMGVSGEVYIGGPAVSRDYLNRPALTAEKFFPDPFSDIPGARLFRTGDLARWEESGELEFIGRTDEQVKIRGFRIELGEIEAVLARHGWVRECAVVAREDRLGEKCLVAYVVGIGLQVMKGRDLRSYLKAHLPEYMVPSAFVELSELPLTVHGKLDRRALPEPDTMGEEQTYIGPRDAEEEILCGIISEVLGLERVGIEDNFFELGGHSLLATKVISRVRNTFKVELPLRALFEAPTVEQLAERVRGGRRGRTEGARVLMRVDREGNVPLSFSQQRLWLIDQLEPGGTSYNIPFGLRLRGNLEHHALQRSLKEIVRRHEVLRTTFTIHEGSPIQKIAAEAEIGWEEIDLLDIAEAKREEEARRLAWAASKEPFDLGRGPLLRIKLLSLGQQDHVLLLNMHHIISDGWSMAIMVREFTHLYQAYAGGEKSLLPDLAIQYADFAVWQREWLQGAVLEEQLQYWKKQLAGVSVLELPVDHPRPAVMTHRGERAIFKLSKKVAEELKELGRREGVTLFMSLLSAFQVVLGRYAGQNDVVVGTAIANRNRGETEGLIGFFVNNLVLRTDLNGSPSIRELLARVRKLVLEAFENQDVPFEKLVEELAPQVDMSRAPLFQVTLVLQNTAREEVQLHGLRVAGFSFESNVTTNYDLSLGLSESADGMEGELTYASDLYETETAERLLGHLRVALESMVAAPDRRIGELSLLTSAERQQMLGWNQTAFAYPAEKCVHQLFEEQAQRTPGAIAARTQGREVHYAELNRRANQLAHYLMKLGVGPEVKVGLFVDPCIDMLVGLLGILKAGGAYVPLDPSYPPDRLSYMFENAQIPVLLTQERLCDQLVTPWVQIVVLDAQTVEWQHEEEGNPQSEAASGNLAYVMYTSGSTGQPKGVQVQHQGLVNLSRVQQQMVGIQAEDRVLQFASLSFDASIWEICMALCNGASLYVNDSAEVLAGASLTRVIREERITVATLPPSVLSTIDGEQFNGLSRLIVAGEAVSEETVKGWTEGRRFFNAYGPTEGTVCASVMELTPEHQGKPLIGKPIGNARLYVVSEEMELTPIGVSGELCLAGAGLARGYLDQQARTAERFVPDPYSQVEGARMYRTGDRARWRNDGNLEFLGRKDQQVKLRGYRIELEEIESVLAQSPWVRECVVVVREDEPGEKRLVAYVVGENGDGNCSDVELREYLRQKLPDYMVPSVYVQLDELPLTLNKKVDRKSLPKPEEKCAETVLVPLDDVELYLTGIWEDIFKVSHVGRTQTFFDLGGHSLLALTLIKKIKEKFEVELPLSAVFESPTVEKLASMLRHGYRTGRRSNLVPLQTRGSKRPLFFVHPGGGGAVGYLYLSRLLGNDQPFYGFQALDEEEIQRETVISIEERAALYIDSLQRVQPHGPYLLGGWSFGAYVAYEMAQQLRRQNEEVAALFLLDVTAQPAREVMRRLIKLDDDAAFLLDAIRETTQVEFSLQAVEHETSEVRLHYLYNQLLAARVLPPDAEMSHVRNFIKGTRLRGQSLTKYTLLPYPETVTLIRALEQEFWSEGPELDPDDETVGFAKICQSLKLHFVPEATHYNLIAPPHVEKLKVILEKCIHEAELREIFLDQEKSLAYQARG